MSTLTNSIVKGFGMTLGRKAANSLVNSKHSNVVRKSGSLTFWQGIKTILWFFPMYMLSLVVVMIFDAITGNFKSNSNYEPNFTVVFFVALFMTVCIGYDYYKKNKC